MNFEYTTVEDVNSLKIYFAAIALTEKELSVSFDKKEGILDIKGSTYNEAITKIMDVNISGSIFIKPKFRSETIKATVKNGLACVEFGLAKDVNVVEFKTVE